MFEHKSPEQELQIKINFVFGIGNRKYKPERHKLNKVFKEYIGICTTSLPFTNLN